MAEMNMDIALSLAIIILTVLAIIVYIVSGAGIAFYAIFIVAVIVMFLTWNRISKAPLPAAGQARRGQARKAARKVARRRR